MSPASWRYLPLSRFREFAVERTVLLQRTEKTNCRAFHELSIDIKKVAPHPKTAKQFPSANGPVVYLAKRRTDFLFVKSKKQKIDTWLVRCTVRRLFVVSSSSSRSSAATESGSAWVGVNRSASCTKRLTWHAKKKRSMEQKHSLIMQRPISEPVVPKSRGLTFSPVF
jgi:hypothetical protein